MSQPDIEELVAEYIERREAGESLEPGEFAREHPQEQEEILAALQRVDQAEKLMQDPGWPTERLGPYRMRGTIGRGGMGRVFKAVHDDRPDEEIALKVLSPLAVSDARARSRFSREGRALEKIDHPGIVRVLEFGVVDGTPYLAMEWVQGPSLEEVLSDARSARRSGDKDPPSDLLSLGGELSGHERVAWICAKLARAVATVHASGVLHRDVKPANVILRGDGSPVLVDFGLARGEETVSLTSSGDLLGTPRYMSPEQARGEEVDERADVHALGVVLYELLTLDAPHQGADALSVLRSVTEKPIPSVMRSDPSVPRPLKRIVERASAYRRDARYMSVAELAEDLEAFLRGDGLIAKRFSAWERLQEAWLLRRKTLVGSLLIALSVAVGASLQREEQDLELLVAQACLAYAAGDLEKTAEEAERIIEIDSDNQTAQFLASVSRGQLPTQSADPVIDLLIQGMVHRREMRWSEARSDFEEAHDLEPESRLAKIMLDQVNSEMFEGQVGKYEGILQDDPDSPSSWRRRGELLYEQERFQEAERAWTKVVELEPGDSLGWKMLALTHYQLAKRSPEKSALYQRATEDIAHSTISTQLDYADGLLRGDKWDAAAHVREVIQKVLGEEPENARAMELMGWSYDYQHEFPEALKWYERAHQQDPSEPAYSLEIAAVVAGSMSATCAQCREFFEKNPDYLDPVEVETYALKVLVADQGSSNYTLSAADYARNAGRTEAMEARIEVLLSQPGRELSNAAGETLRKALEILRR